jgi:hypothetical protein
MTGLATKLTESANNPEAVRKIASELQQNAPAIVGAIVQGTKAEGLVDPAIIPKK